MTAVNDVVAERLGISYRQLDHWLTRYGDVLLDDPDRANPGSGNPREVSAVELDRLSRMADLVLRDGVKPVRAAQLASRPRPRDLALAWIVGRGECA